MPATMDRARASASLELLLPPATPALFVCLTARALAQAPLVPLNDPCLRGEPPARDADASLTEAQRAMGKNAR